MTANRLLVIDDEPAIGNVISIVARRCGYEVEATTDPATFLQHVTNWHPSHIIMDLQMPVVDGVELLRGIGDRRCPAKIVIASGVDGRIVESARRLGVERGLEIAGTLAKPFRVPELTQLLEALKRVEDWSSEQGLAAAIDAKALFLVYQPKISLTTGDVLGYEGLARWRHAQHGVIFPDQFIPLAENSALIDRLTDAIVDIGLEQIAAWGHASSASLALNLSGKNLGDLSFADRLAGLCAKLDVAPERLVLELTESSTMADPVGAMDILTRLRLKGFHLAIDDFGTGYSSLRQLARLPFSELKIDKSFVMETHQSAEARTIVKSVIVLAHNLGLKAVAEGVEDGETLRLLIEWGCDVAQGYHIAKPLAPAQIESWRADWATRRASVWGARCGSHAVAS